MRSRRGNTGMVSSTLMTVPENLVSKFGYQAFVSLLFMFVGSRKHCKCGESTGRRSSRDFSGPIGGGYKAFFFGAENDLGVTSNRSVLATERMGPRPSTRKYRDNAMPSSRGFPTMAVYKHLMHSLEPRIPAEFEFLRASQVRYLRMK